MADRMKRWWRRERRRCGLLSADRRHSCSNLVSCVPLADGRLHELTANSIICCCAAAMRRRSRRRRKEGGRWRRRRRRHSHRVSPANSSSDAAAADSIKSRQLIPCLERVRSRREGLHFFTPVFDERQVGGWRRRRKKKTSWSATRGSLIQLANIITELRKKNFTLIISVEFSLDDRRKSRGSEQVREWGWVSVDM